MRDLQRLRRIRRLTRTLQCLLDECEPAIAAEHPTNAATLEPAFNYERKRRSTAPSPESLFIKPHTEENMENLTTRLEEMGLGAEVEPHVAVTL